MERLNSEYNERECKKCGVKVIDVRDDLTKAPFPVEASFVRYPGFVLEPAGQDGRRNPLAFRADIYVPHTPQCQGEGEEPAGKPESDGTEVTPGGIAAAREAVADAMGFAPDDPTAMDRDGGEGEDPDPPATETEE